MTDNVQLQYDYLAQLTQAMPDLSTGEIAIHLSVELSSPMGGLIIERGINMKEEKVFYHRKLGNIVYVYGINRTYSKTHDIGSQVVIDPLFALNYSIKNSFEQRYIFKSSNTSAIIKGGNFFIEGVFTYVPDLNTSSIGLTSASNNYITISNGNYIISNTPNNSKFLIGTITTDVNGNITVIDNAKTLCISNGMTTDEKNKLAGLDHNSYELSANKSTSIRADGIANNTKYPTEKAVRDELDNKVDKDGDKVLSDNNYSDFDYDTLVGLRNLHLNEKNFEVTDNKITNIRISGEASGVKYPTEKAVRDELDKYILAVSGKQLSTYDFNNYYKSGLQAIIDDNTEYQNIIYKRNTIRTLNNASNTYYPSEKAVRLALEEKVSKDGNKILSDNNFSDDMKTKLDNLTTQAKTKVSGGEGISVTDLGTNGWEVSLDMEKGVRDISEFIEVNPIIEGILKAHNVAKKFIDEQAYVVLTDHERQGFYGNTKFKNGNNPRIKVFYHNPNSSGVILIQTNIRIVNSIGEITSKYKSIPYPVVVGQYHGSFELGEESFTGLDYTNSDTMYIQVYREAMYWTDYNSWDFNTVLDDYDTLRGDLRIKSMTLGYEQQFILDETKFNGILQDGACTDIALVENGLIIETYNQGNNDFSLPTTNGIRGVNRVYDISNVSIRRIADATLITENQLLDIVASLVLDLTRTGIMQDGSIPIIGDPIISEPFSTINELNQTALNADYTNINGMADLIGTMIKTINVLYKTKCGNNGLAIPSSINEIWDIQYHALSRYLDLNTATLKEYINFVGTLILDLDNANLFNGGEIIPVIPTYVILNGSIERDLDNNLNSLYEAGNILYAIISDLKLSRIIR